MTNEQKGFIITVNMNINEMGKWNRISWNKFPVEMRIEDGTLITKVDDTEYKDVCPMKGNRRNREEIANVVCGRICEAWGGTMEEVSAHAAAALNELYASLDINA